MAQLDGTKTTLTNPVHGLSKRTVMVREGTDQYTTHSEIIRDGETTVMEVHARRVR